MRNTYLPILGIITLLFACEDTTSNATNEPLTLSDDMNQGGQGGGPDQEVLPDQEVILEPITVPEFGRVNERQVVSVAHRSDGLSHPRDLEFDPENPNHLWIVDRDWDGNIILFDAGTESQRVDRLRDMAATHFMDEVSSIAFSDQRSFGTCQESRNGMDGMNLFPNDFMGPVLWSADLMIHCVVNQQPIFGGLNGSHLDMLHQSPLCMGIAHQEAHVFFVADGTNGHIVRYDFQEPHVPGGDDHSDGRVSRYPELSFTRVPDIPSHMQVVGNELFYLDTGAGQLKVANLATGEETETLIPENEPLELFNVIEGVEQRTLIDGLDTPSGLSITDDHIFISLPKSGEIIAYDREGQELERIDTGKAGIMGLTTGPQGHIWFVNAYEGTVNWLNPMGDSTANDEIEQPPQQGDCQYPVWDGQIGLGHTLPPFSWSSSAQGSQLNEQFSTTDIYCGAEWQSVETVIFVVIPEWIRWLIEYVEYIDALAPQIESEGGRIVYVGAQSIDGQPLSLSDTQSLLQEAAPQRSGIRVGESSNEFPFALMDTALIPHLPAAFVVRRSDMKVIAIQSTRGLTHLPYVEITQDPMADWSEPGVPSIVPTLPSNCAEGEEEDSEPNDFPEEATTIGIGEYFGGICNRRGDFYFIDVQGPWTLDLEFSHAVGDLDLILFANGQPVYDAQGMPRGAGSGTDNETFSWRGQQFVYIFGYDSATSPYRLTISER